MCEWENKPTQVLLDKDQHCNAFSISGNRNSEPSQSLSVNTHSQPVVCRGTTQQQDPTLGTLQNSNKNTN